MKKVYLIEVDEGKIQYCELSKKGYEFYNGPFDAEANELWGEWQEGTMKEIKAALKK